MITLPLLGLALALNGAAPAPLQANGPQLPSSAAERGEELTVYLMTMGPGPAVWERFGHNAIWVRDRLRGTDVAYNYGMFSFDQENFILRFIQGRMNYWMEGFDAAATANFYIQSGRSVWAQELNLRPNQRADLRDFLEANELPENRFYRYDYYTDNCSTRVRDAIDLVLGGQIAELTDSIPSGATYRDHTRRLTSADPLLYTGLMAGLGHEVDREISVWEEMFLPMRLRDRIRDLTIIDPGGATVPLVRAEEELYLSPAQIGPVDQSARVGGYLFGGVILALGIVVTAYFRARRRDAAVAFRFLTTGWTLVAGILGVAIFFLWSFTDHTAAYRNENLLIFNPLVFLLAVILPFASLRRPRVLKFALALSVVVALLSLAAVLFKPLPGFFQQNAELIALGVPPNLAVAVALYILFRSDRPVPIGGRKGKARKAPVTV